MARAEKADQARTIHAELARLYAEAAGCIDELRVRCSNGSLPTHEATILYQDIVSQILAEARYLTAFAGELPGGIWEQGPTVADSPARAPRPIKRRTHPPRAA
jgi:hypothetical protein